MTTGQRGGSDAIAEILATEDEERRQVLILQFVAADPASALAEAERLIASGESHRRTLGADLLGPLVDRDASLATPVGDVLIPRVPAETEPSALQAAITALGHAGDERARSAVIDRASFNDVEVRLAVAWALPSLGLDDAAIAALCELSRDPDEDVRDWATFGLGQSDATDSATIEALFARTDDPHYDTRCEAILGLAMRHDPRARSLVDRELARPMVGALIEEARDLVDRDQATPR